MFAKACIALVVLLGLLDLGAATGRIPCSRPVTYSLVNSCMWTSMTHPTDYPPTANFSPLCGGAHSKRVVLGRVGDKASQGIRLIAEEGDCSKLVKKISICQRIGLCGSPREYPCSAMSGTCSHTGSVSVNYRYPYVSFYSMLAPSPDWFVGVGSVALCQDGYWVPSYQRDLLAYDAGTDEGPTFMSPNMPNSYRMPITVFNGMDASNIFYNQETGALNPLCKFSLTLDG